MHVHQSKHACISDCMIGNALDGMCVGLVLMNEAGRVSWLNRAASRMLAVRVEECQNQLLSAVLKDPNLANFWHAAKKSSDTIMDGVSINYPHPTELKINATTSINHDGEVIGRVLLFCDVTNERALQVEMSQAVASRLIGLAGPSTTQTQPAAGLTPTELRVLRLIGTGGSNEAIAEQLEVAPSTLRSHLKSIYRKLNLHSRSEAVSYAVKNNLA